MKKISLHFSFLLFVTFMFTTTHGQNGPLGICIPEDGSQIEKVKGQKDLPRFTEQEVLWEGLPNSNYNKKEKKPGNSKEIERTLVVCEEFTGTWCQYCPGAAMGLDDLIENEWPVAVIAYHYSDSYENAASLARNNYYEAYAYPTVWFDGVESISAGSGSQSLYENYWPVVESQLTIPALASVEIVGLMIDGSTLTADIQIDSDSPINNDNLVLHAVLTESHIPEWWYYQEELNFVERAMFNGATGTSVDLSDNTETVPIVFELDGTWSQLNCELVVFVQDSESREILNGNKKPLIESLNYCQASTLEENEYISNVECGDINNDSEWQGGVANYTYLVSVIEEGGTVDIIISSGNANSSNAAAVWVDWNNDSVFSTGGDEEYMLENVGGTGETFTGIITCPLGADLGYHTMRVRLVNNTTPDPCGESDYGEIEDYTIKVIEELEYCDASTQNEDEYIANVFCGDINNSSGWQGGVADYTDLSTEIEIFGSVDITVTNGSAYGPDSVIVWVDWNNNYEFEIEGDEEFILENVGGTGQTFTGTIICPVGTEVGDHRMRVRMVYNRTPEPCGEAAFGEIEDYTITTLGVGGCEAFDDLTVGGLVAEQLGGSWTTWGGTSAEDATVSDTHSNSPNNSFVVDASTVDLVFRFGDVAIENNQWLYSNYIYVPTGFSGYFNVQGDPVPGTEWVLDLFFNDGGTGSFGTASTETFEYAQNTWILVEINFDLDTDIARVLFDGVIVTEFAWDGTIGGVNYYGDDQGGTPGAYFDDVCFTDGWKILPPAPLNLTGPTSVEVATDFELSWNTPNGASSETITGYNVYRKLNLNNKSFQIVDFVSDTTYTDNLLTPGYSYSYYITAVYDPQGESYPSNEWAVDVLYPAQPAPVNLTGPTSIEAGTDFVLTWTAPESGNGEMIEFVQHDEFNPAVQLFANQQFMGWGYGVIFDLNDYPNATIEMLDFRHAEVASGQQGPWEYSIHIVDWDTYVEYIELGPFQTTVENDWELEVDLGSYPGTYGLVGVFIEPLQMSPLFTRPLINMDDEMNGVSFNGSLEDGYSNMENPVGDFFIDLWIMTAGDKQLIKPTKATANDLSKNNAAHKPNTSQLNEVTGFNVNQMENKGVKALSGYKIYRKLNLGSFEVIGYVTDTMYIDNVPDPGSYTYYVTAVYDPQGESNPSNEWVVDITVGIRENIANSTELFPNPATNYVNINSAYTIEFITVYNFAGHVILSEAISTTSHSVNTSEFQSGIYLFRIETEEGRITRRIIIE